MRNPTICLATLLVILTAHHATADSMFQLGGGAGPGGVIATGGAAARAGRVVGDARAAAGRDAGEATLLVGFGPRIDRQSANTVAWDEECLRRLASTGADRCWRVAARTSRHPARTSGWLGAVVGVRASRERRELVAAARIHPTNDTLGDHVELGITAVVDGRGEQLFVHHASFAPGWYVRLQLRGWRAVVAGEVGITGLAAREMDGRFATDVRALVTVGFAVGAP